MGFQTPQYKLSKLLEQAGNGTIQLPDFQRGYKWDEERVRSLLVTVTLGHPLGVLMLLQTGNDQVRFKPKAIEGTPPEAGKESPDLLLLDGQQRLTSLYQSLTGSGVVDTEDTRKKQVKRRFYIDIARALEDPARRDESIVTMPGDGIERTNFGKDIRLDVSTPDKERVHGYFPFRLVYDSPGQLDWLWNFPGATGDEVARRALIHRFQAEILTPMQSYEIPAIELDRWTTKGAVATVFEKVNTGGLPLNVFELLTATFAGDAAYFAEHGDDFRLNDDWQLTDQVIAAHPVLHGIRNTDFLQAVTLLVTAHGKSFTSARKEDVLRLELSDYLAWADKVRAALVWVAQFLRDEHIHRARDIPYPTQLVPLAVIRVILGEKADIYGVRNRLRQWFWCGILGELYGGATETRFARDVDQVPDWVRAGISGNTDVPVPATVLAATFAESRLLSLRTRQSAAYKGLHALLMAQGAKDWRFNKTFDYTQYLALDVDIHHIFPKKWCNDNEVPQNLRESIVNKTPLAAKTNLLIGGASPATYMRKLEAAAGLDSDELDAIVGAHLIDTKALRHADFEAFFLARRRALLGLVEQAMGKRAQQDVEAGALTGGEEAPEAFADEADDPEDTDVIVSVLSR
ncbi:DUF262 domain-containing protein [Micromonospora peucetia]|uniref:DUF262 domain-containing protein n=1 Tax=Micromonospora peucetia TaxID=47871 RepID=A0ABZ1EDW5_9ACTN|nr:DUF262 domain-containing protein [Micromonospora peucetia]WSA32172.1 DUF262 domain-containing protein [Micromonospora peucetia]